MTRIFPAALLALATLLLPQIAGGVTFKVNVTQDQPDSVPGDGFCSIYPVSGMPGFTFCSLRAAIMEGNATDGNDIVDVQLIPGATYVLSTPEPSPDGAAAGDLDITRRMTIGVTDESLPRARIDANHLSRAFQLHSNSPFSVLSGVEIVNGRDEDGAAVYVGPGVSGIRLVHANIHDNTHVGETVGCAIEGGIIIQRSVVHDNGTTDKPTGGVCTNDNTTIIQSTISHNMGYGLNVQGGASLWLHSSTVTLNTYDAFLYYTKNSNIRNSTIGRLDAVYGDLEISGTIISDGCFVEPEVTFVSQWNLYVDTSCPLVLFDHSHHNATLNLSELGNWGGPTPTRKPLAGSEAIDFAPEHVCNELDTDQRGLPRPVSSDDAPMPRCDIGAVEVQPELQEPPEDPPAGPIFADDFEGL